MKGMNAKTKTLFLALFAVLLMCMAVFVCGFSGTASADTEQPEVVNGYAYYGIKMNIDVGKDKVLDVEEEYKVKFHSASVSQFKRNITCDYISQRLINGEKVLSGKFSAGISQVYASVEGLPTEFTENKGTIRISPTNDKYFETEQLYTISLKYRFNLSADRALGTDDLIFYFFNEGRYSYQTGSVFDITVNFPSDAELSNVCILDHHNELLSLEDNEFLNVDGTTVTLRANMGEQKHLQVLLPNGYFDKPAYDEYWVFYGFTLVLIAAGVIVAFIFRGRKPVYTVQYTPPMVSPVYFSAFWHGYARKRDVATLILQWAHMGCVKLKKDGKRDIIIEKLKPLPDDRIKEEVEYFNALFAKGKIYSSKEARSRGNMWYRYRISSAIYDLMEEAKTPEAYTKGTEAARIAVPIMSFLTLSVLMTYMTYVLGNGMMIIVIILSVMMSIFLGSFLFLRPFFKQVRGVLLLRIIVGAMLFGMITPFAAIFGILTSVYRPEFDYAFLIVICAVWILACMIFVPKFVTKRTDESQDLYAKMLGFKKFISMVEVPRLELMVEESPEYYYDILPYSMIMGLSRKVDKKFAAVKGAAPDWADGFDLRHLSSSLFNSVKSAMRGKARKMREGDNEK